jgi:RNA polymerase-binding transcription factor DksA
MAGVRPGKDRTRREPIPPGATKRASDADTRPGEPPSDLGDRHAAGTPAGGTEVGGLAGTNIGDGSPDNADLEQAMAGDLDEEAAGDGPPYGGISGGAVGGTPAEGRSSGGQTHGGISPGGVHRGDSTIGADPDAGSAWGPVEAFRQARRVMTKAELEHYRQRLLTLGARLKGAVSDLEAEALRNTGGAASGSLSNTPIHPADLGTDHFEQELCLCLLENEEQRLEEVAAALARIAQGTFGRCESCGRPIAKERLEAIPFTRLCIDCARQASGGEAPGRV